MDKAEGHAESLIETSSNRFLVVGKDAMRLMMPTEKLLAYGTLMLQLAMLSVANVVMGKAEDARRKEVEAARKYDELHDAPPGTYTAREIQEAHDAAQAAWRESSALDREHE